jgi:hypothetical protein
MVILTCHPSYVGKQNKVQASPGRKQDCIPKITNVKSSDGVAQMVEQLPSKCKTLSSNPSTAKKKKRERKNWRQPD